MTELQLERLLDYKCTRCGAPAPDTNLCAKHQLDQNARSRAAMKELRKSRREQEQCAFCGAPSTTYRCGNDGCPGTSARCSLLTPSTVAA